MTIKEENEEYRKRAVDADSGLLHSKYDEVLTFTETNKDRIEDLDDRIDLLTDKIRNSDDKHDKEIFSLKREILILYKSAVLSEASVTRVIFEMLTNKLTTIGSIKELSIHIGNIKNQIMNKS